TVALHTLSLHDALPIFSPTWDTALAMKALLESGMDPAHPMLARAGEWLVANQIFRPGDWSVLNPELEPGGWAFEFANDWFPDVRSEEHTSELQSRENLV